MSNCRSGVIHGLLVTLRDAPFLRPDNFSLQTKLYSETTTGFQTKAFMYCMGSQPYSSKMLGKSGSGDVEAVGMMLVIVSVSSQLPLSSARITDWKRERTGKLRHLRSQSPPSLLKPLSLTRDLQ